MMKSKIMPFPRAFWLISPDVLGAKARPFPYGLKLPGDLSPRFAQKSAPLRTTAAMETSAAVPWLVVQNLRFCSLVSIVFHDICHIC